MQGSSQKIKIFRNESSKSKSRPTNQFLVKSNGSVKLAVLAAAERKNYQKKKNLFLLAAFLGSATKTNRTAVTAGCSRRGIGTGLQRRRLMQNQQQAPRYCCSSNVTPPSAKKKLIIINRKFSLSLSSSPPPPSRLTSQRKKKRYTSLPSPSFDERTLRWTERINMTFPLQPFCLCFYCFFFRFGWVGG